MEDNNTYIENSSALAVMPAASTPAGGKPNFRLIARSGRSAPASFIDGLALEESGRLDAAAAVYQEVLEHTPNDAQSAINLGTYYYHRKDFSRAEALYRRAAAVNPQYALAFFNLGNVLDDLDRIPEAIESYQTALRLSPDYADAHFNLALIYDRMAQHRKALRHWQSYIRLNKSEPWYSQARSQIRRILEGESLKIVYRHAD